MARVVAEHPERFPGASFNVGGQGLKMAPELRKGPVVHRRSQSIGSVFPFVARRSSSLSLAANFGRGRASSRIRSHSTSPLFAVRLDTLLRPSCKARANSSSWAVLRGGKEREIRAISATALFMYHPNKEHPLMQD